MIKREVILVASISGIFGIMMGVLVASWAWLQSNSLFARVGAVAKTEAAIATKVELLEHLRSGRYKDATSQLEALLDGDLVGAGAFARDGVEFTPDTRKAIAVERRARAVSGYEPANATVSAAVQETFRLLPQDDIEARITSVNLR